VNIAFRGQMIDVSITRLPSGRVVRQMTVKTRYHS